MKSPQTQILGLLGLISEQTNAEVSPTRLEFIYEALRPYPSQQVIDALKRIAFDARKFPTAGEILAEMGIARQSHKPNSTDDATVIAGKITNAISRFGYTGESEAKAALGALGWEVVRLSGGWRQVCEVSTDELGIKTAQWRELARSLLDRGDKPLPELPFKEADRGLALIQGIIAGIESSKKENAL